MPSFDTLLSLLVFGLWGALTIAALLGVMEAIIVVAAIILLATSILVVRVIYHITRKDVRDGILDGQCKKEGE